MMHNKRFEPIGVDVEAVVAQVVDAALQVHKALGPGLLESVYEACLCHELAKRRIQFVRQCSLPVVYDGLRLESGLRIDLLVDGSVVVEVKAVEQVTPLHDAQVITYLKLSNLRVGILINFNVRLIREGIKRLVR
ncbi:MAG: GxxExxY protein [Pirellulales bacterium]